MIRSLVICWCLGACLTLMGQLQVNPPMQAIPAPNAPVIPIPPTGPNQPTSTPIPRVEPVPGPPTPVAPPPAVNGPVRSFTLSGERYVFSGITSVYQAFGNVTLESDQVVIKADEATYDETARLVLARGTVSVRRKTDNIVYWGNTLSYNLQSGDWHFIDWSAEFPPAFVGPPFVAPLYINGKDLTAISNTAPITALNSSATTCDLPQPHYHITAKKITIYPGDKLIAHSIDFYVLDHRVLHLPWFFLSLRQNRSPIVPEFGENSYEGYYLRLLYQYVFNPQNLLGVRLDLTQKLGVGLGLDDFYTVPHGYGEAFVYGRQGLKEYVTRLDHTQQFPSNITLTATGDVRQNSLTSFQSTTGTTITTVLQRPTTHSNLLINYSRNLSQSNFLTDQTSTNLTYELRYPGQTFKYNGAYSSFGEEGTGLSQPANQELWNHFMYTHDFPAFNGQVLVDQHMDLGGAAGTFSGVQHLPELTLTSDQQKLHLTLLHSLPTQFTLDWGVYDDREVSTNTEFNRYLFNMQSTLNPVKIGRTTLTLSGSLRQTVYGDPDTTALYSYYIQANANTTLGGNANALPGCGATVPVVPNPNSFPGTNVNVTTNTDASGVVNTLSYTKRAAYGFTPFQFDVVYPSQQATESLKFFSSWQNTTFATGRDLNNDLWNPLSVVMNINVTPKAILSNSLNYDLNNSRWGILYSQFNWRQSPLRIVNLGSAYDLSQGQLQRITASTQWVINPLWRVQYIAQYSGITHELIADELLLTRDLHCWDVTLAASEQQSYVFLYFRLKALALPIPSFGIGHSGQIISVNPGAPF